MFLHQQKSIAMLVRAATMYMLSLNLSHDWDLHLAVPSSKVRSVCFISIEPGFPPLLTGPGFPLLFVILEPGFPPLLNLSPKSSFPLFTCDWTRAGLPAFARGCILLPGRASRFRLGMMSYPFYPSRASRFRSRLYLVVSFSQAGLPAFACGCHRIFFSSKQSCLRRFMM